MRTTLSQYLFALLIGFVGPAFADAASIVFSDSGPNAAAIQDTVDNFRAVIGGVNNGNVAGPLDTGRREINWDGGGAAAPVQPNMPKDTFLNNRWRALRPRHNGVFDQRQHQSTEPSIWKH